MDKIKNYAVKRSEESLTGELPIYAETSDKMSMQEISKICNNKWRYFINNNSSLFIKAYLFTIVFTLLLCIITLVLYTI